MNTTAVLLLLTCLIAAAFLKVSWLILGFLLLLVIFAMLLVPSGTPAKQKAGTVAKEKKEVEILHPVVYEDVGGPAMYPESVQIVHLKNALSHKSNYAKVGASVGVVTGAIGKGLKKLIGSD